MKRIFAMICIIMLLLTGCVGTGSVAGFNYQLVDLQYKYNYAIIQLQNGEVIEGEVEQWKDYEDGEQLQVKINGVVYLTNSFNCTLMYKPE